MKNFFEINRTFAVKKTKLNNWSKLRLDSLSILSRQSDFGNTHAFQRHFARLAAMVTLLLTFACGNVWATTATITIGNSNSSSYAASFTSSSTSDKITANATKNIIKATISIAFLFEKSIIFIMLFHTFS